MKNEMGNNFTDYINSHHVLKTWPEEYAATISGLKTFEFRKSDRNFKAGDILILEEWNPETSAYTGRFSKFRITYILDKGFGLPYGYCVMSIVPIV